VVGVDGFGFVYRVDFGKMYFGYAGFHIQIDIVIDIYMGGADCIRKQLYIDAN